MDRVSEEAVSEEVPVEAVSEEAVVEGPSKKAIGAFRIPEHWPRWNKVCGAKLRGRNATCRRYAVIGNPRCKLHGSGGEAARMHGQLRYLCWIITGGPQDMPVELACTIALAVFAEVVFNQGVGTVDQQIKAAMWMTSLVERT